MAVTRENKESKMTAVVNTGTQADPVYKNRIVNYVNPDATDTLMSSIGALYGGLQSHSVNKIKRTDICDLVSE